MASDGRWYPPESMPIEFMPPPDPDGRVTSAAEVIGTAGKSARDHAARITKDAEKWSTGADGEELTGAVLDDLPSAFKVLHDLHVPGSKANIDHLVVGPSGVWLIDSKKYRHPLRFDGGTIWTGKYPKTDDIDKVSFYAQRTAAVLRVPVTPVLCFIGQAVPSGAERIAGVHLVILDDLMTLVSVGGTPLDDVESVARLARTLRTPTPVQRPKPSPTGHTSAPAPSAPSTGCAGRTLAIIAAIVGLLVLLSVLVSLGTRAKDTLTKMTTGPSTTASTTIAPPRLDGPTIDTPSPSIGIGLICTKHGSGWEAHFHWSLPTDPVHVPVAYEVVSLTPGVVVEPKLWPNKDAVAKPLLGLPPNLDIVIAAQAILADGTRLAPRVSKRTTGPTVC